MDGGSSISRRPVHSMSVSGNRVLLSTDNSTTINCRDNMDGKEIQVGRRHFKDDNFSERPLSISSGIGDCDGNSLSSLDEELMDNIIKEFDYKNTRHEQNEVISSSDKLLRYVETNTIGNGVCFQGPFGEREAIYCDYTASGRPLRFVEEYIKDHVHPLYANTHSNTNFMSRQTTLFREEAREIIKRSVNACEDDALIFTGSGTTGAIHKLLGVLEISKRRAKTTVVFVGPYEHHSNILPWKEAGAMVHRIPETDQGKIDTKQLKKLLKKYCSSLYLLIGCFSAASNVTGIITDTSLITSILHEFGALSFWDYATGAPYLDIDMNPTSNESATNLSKDAIFLSPHKFVGGPDTPGILVAKRHLFKNAVPTSCGGGTVLYVTRDTHAYLKNPEEREEGGTPAIIGSIRSGLVFQLKDAIGTEAIKKIDKDFTKLAFDTFNQTPEIEILGSSVTDRLPIFSFLIRHPKTKKLLHHNLVAVLLNDLYGVQVRSGCACAGPYAQDLLGINEDLASKFTYFLLDNKGRQEKHNSSELKTEQMEIMKPGFTRLNLPYFASRDVIEYILTAVADVAKNGWKLLPQYTYNIKSGAWFHRLEGRTKNNKDLVLDSLYDNNYYRGAFNSQNSPYTITHSSTAIKQMRSHKFQQYLSSARQVYDQEVSIVKTTKYFQNDYCMIESKGVASDLVWFMQPHEAQELLVCQNKPTEIQKSMPFTPKKFDSPTWKHTIKKNESSKLQTACSTTVQSSVCVIL